MLDIEKIENGDRVAVFDFFWFEFL
jgi:hypothetical protein